MSEEKTTEIKATEPEPAWKKTFEGCDEWLKKIQDAWHAEYPIKKEQKK